MKRELFDGVSVFPVGLGCMGMSEFYGATNDAESLRVLHRAAELGVNFLDTADMYGPHHNEELIGKFLKETKEDFVVATKFGIVREPGQYARAIDNTPEYLRKCCEASLKRLDVDCIDLFYAHRLNPDHPIEDMMGEMSKLAEEGKIRAAGICEASAATLERAHAVFPVAALQSEYSLWSRGLEENILPTCRKLGVKLVAYSPLGRGFLTGSFRKAADVQEGDFRSMLPRFSPGNLEQNQVFLQEIDKLAEDKGVTTGQIALAWVLAKGDDIIPIPGTKRIKYLEQNCAAAEVELTSEEVSSLEEALNSVEVLGLRYTAEGMKGVEV